MSARMEELAAALPTLAWREGDEAWAVGGAVPGAVASPGDVDEVVALLRAAGERGVGVVPLGGRTQVGAEPPTAPFVALSTERLSGVEAYEPADLTATCRAGTTLEELGGVLAERGQWLPVDPPLAPKRTVGGLVATGAAGPLGMAYGAPRDHVLGLTVVTGDGRVLRLGGRVMKNVAGFDLVKLMVGSRGTLGVVVSATLRLFPRPARDRVLVLEAEGVGALLEAARRVATAPVVPASAVLVHPWNPAGGAGAAPGNAGRAALVVRVQGRPETVDADAAALLGNLPAVVLEGEEAGVALAAARDHGADGALVVRAAVLPALLPEALAALRDALPGGALAADVMSGRVRGSGSAVEGADRDALLRLRSRLAGLGGSLVLDRADPRILERVPAHGGLGRASALGGELRRRFDPGGVLSPGRFRW